MNRTKQKVDVLANGVQTTKNYKLFRTLQGNRNVNEKHVKELQKLMLKNGNLTDQFPIIIDTQGNIIDGQHRAAALEGLGWEIGFRVEENATIETVRSINQGNRNWNWRDLASSYAERGADSYAWFLNFVDQYGLMFYPSLKIIANVEGFGNHSARNAFNTGELTVKNPASAHKMAMDITDVQRLVQLTGSDFTSALITIMASPHYNHERMLKKLRDKGEQLPTKARVSDYTRQLEEIFNHGMPAERRSRLF